MGNLGDWWRGCVIYQVYPRSFQDTTGDGSGDLVGITARLPYIASLGVDAVWLSPFFKSPMADMGYDVSDYCDVDPMFGTLADFDRLIAEAHRLGLKIIIDQVLSHTSDQHPWFIESRADRDNPKADWYVWAAPKPDGGPPNNWLSNFGGSAWEWDSVRKQYYLHNFLISQPDLNFHNPQVQAALLETVRFWLERGVDGFRLDTVNHYIHDRWLRDNPPSAEALAGTIDTTNPYGYQLHLFNKTQPENLVFLQRFRRLLNEYDGRAAVGEVGDEWRSLQTVAAYTSGGDKLQMCYTFDMLGPDFSAGYVHKCVSAFEAMVIDGWYCWAFSNHDVMRHVTRWTRPGEDPEAVARFAIGLMACLRGSVCLYQGEELGLQEAELAFEDLRDPYGIRFWPGFKGRDGCRTPMVWEANAPNAGFSTGKPWLPVLPAQSRQSVNVQQTDPSSVLNHYRAVLAARKQHPALVTGSIDLFEVQDDILAFVRQTGDEKLLCLFNFSDRPADWIVPSGVSTGEPIAFPGAAGSAELGKVALPPLGIFLSRLG
ncbi:alpha glucosidase [Corticibacterium sp. UT-5YL-CI-8]|nr:alpha glucosidase [Tianweitania sp. UT-5YL-CI-8]